MSPKAQRRASEVPPIDTLVVLMLEGRSFDHVLGHFSLAGGLHEGRLAGLCGVPVDGFLRDERYACSSEGRIFFPFEQRDGALGCALSEDRLSVAIAMGRRLGPERYAMDGFVRASGKGLAPIRASRPVPLGFMRSSDLPITSFLARNYAICDQYFAPLPTGSVPNRLMAYSGYSLLENTSPKLLPRHHTVLDWLKERGVRYRVYRDGLSFFSLMPSMHEEVLSERFVPLSRLEADITTESDSTFPQVILVEPTYAAAPLQQGKERNDNQAPFAMAAGERLLLRVYEALTSHPERFARTLFVVTYASSGGFYDHVSPPLVSEPDTPFRTLGLRVPSLLVSPWIEPQSVYSELLDHTSILQFIASRFGDGSPYSAPVERRREQGIGCLSSALTRTSPRVDRPIVPRPPERRGRRAAAKASAECPLEQAYYLAARALCEHAPSRLYRESPELLRAVSFPELH